MNGFDFYNLPESDRESLVGKSFEEEKGGLYFVLDLSPNEFNYGMKQGLICVSPIITIFKLPFFKVYVCSPDDLDIDVCFDDDEIKFRDEVIRFIESIPKIDVGYLHFMEQIADKFGKVIYRCLRL